MRICIDFKSGAIQPVFRHVAVFINGYFHTQSSTNPRIPHLALAVHFLLLDYLQCFMRRFLLLRNSQVKSY